MIDRSVESDAGNGHERRRSAIDGEFEETFETPRFQPETPRFPPETPYYSMDNQKLKNSRSEVNVLLGESSKSLDMEIPLEEEKSGVIAENSDNSHEEIPSEEGEEGKKDDDEGLKETKLDEKEEKSPVYEGEVMLEKSETEDVGSIEKYIPVDEERTLTEDVGLIEKSVPVDEERTLTQDVVEKSVPVDEERTPNVSAEKVDVSSSNEKEVKVVPWPDLEIPAGNGVLNVEVEAISSEKGGDGDGNRNLGRELYLGEENKQPVPADDNSKDLVESVQRMLPQIDVDLTNNKFDISVEMISVYAENSALITEEAGHGSKAPHENSESLVGGRRMNTAAEPSSDAEKARIERNKV